MLQKKSRRLEAQQFVVEGPSAVREVLIAAPSRVLDIFVTESALAKHPDIATLAERHLVDIEPVSEQVLAQMADTVTPQGVIAVVTIEEPRWSDIAAKKPRLICIADQVRDPGNLGTIIRVADAAGADAVIVTEDSVDVYNPKVVRSTTGSLFHLPVLTDVPTRDALQWARDASLQVLVADMAGESLPALFRGGSLAAPTAWVMSNEAHGASDGVRESADKVVAIPHYGLAESLNLATAAAVCLFQSAFAQREHSPGDEGPGLAQ